MVVTECTATPITTSAAVQKILSLSVRAASSACFPRLPPSCYKLRVYRRGTIDHYQVSPLGIARLRDKKMELNEPQRPLTPMPNKEFVAPPSEYVQQMLKAGTPPREILKQLASAGEMLAGAGAATSILRPDANVGTCAAAAATGCAVITRDFLADDKWVELRHLPLALGFVGAWSMPIKSPTGRVLGTFGTYFRERRHPTPEERRGVGTSRQRCGNHTCRFLTAVAGPLPSSPHRRQAPRRLRRVAN
jgi:hypothetical protein